MEFSPMTCRKTTPVFILNKIQLLIGLLALCLGTMVYLTLRSPDQIYFTKYFGLHKIVSEIQSQALIALGYSLPAFLHVFSFILITASFFSYSKKIYVAICTGWFLVECCFELGQKYKIQATRMLFDFFDKIPFLETTRIFFLQGTFDILDLIALALGTIIAFWTLIATSKQHAINTG